MMINKSTYCLFYILLFLVSCSNGDKVKVTKKTGNPTLDNLNIQIGKDTTDHTLLFERANFYFENNYYDGAIVDLQKAIILDNKQAPYYHLLSDVFMDYFRSKESLETIEKCVSVFPKRIPSLLKLAETQLILKQHDNSLATCSRVLDINAQNAEAYFMMGMNLRGVGDIVRAKTAFQKSTELDPELIDAWIILGQIYEDEKDPKALAYYEAAIDVDRTNPSTWHSKAYYLQNIGQLEEALDIYRQINIIDKNYLDAYLNAGIIKLSMDSIPEAYEQFNIMVNIKPQYFISYYYRGLANESMGKTKNAKEDYDTCLKLNSKFTKASKALQNIIRQEQKSSE